MSFLNRLLQERGVSRARCFTLPLGLLSAVAVLLSASAPGARAADPLLPALNDMFNTEYAKAQQFLEYWVRQHPDDFRAWNYLGEALMDREMLRENLFTGSAYLDTGEVFQKRRQPLPKGFEQRVESVFNKAESLEEARLNNNRKDEEALYWLGVTHTSLTEFDFVLLRSDLAALHEGKLSWKENKRLLKLDPGYTDAYFVMGVGNYAVGMLPWYFKLITSLVGFHGNVARGIADLERVGNQGHYARVDARIVLVAIYERQKTYPQALALLKWIEQRYPQNYLAPLEVARIEKLQGNWRAAASTYDRAVAKFVRGEQDPRSLPKTTILYKDGEAHEHLGEINKALALYHEAAKQPGKTLQTYQAAFHAAQLDKRLNHVPEAKTEYQLVASAVPNTQIGRRSRQALDLLH